MNDIRANSPETAGLGTLLRHLVDLLDGDVEAVYRDLGIDCRSRFTPVFRHIDRNGPSSIRQIAVAGGVSHSAISQTVREMLNRGLVESAPGAVDGRERIISLSAEGRALMPRLQAVWRSIWAAADDLSADIGTPLPELLERAIAAVERRAFRERIAERMAATETAFAD